MILNICLLTLDCTIYAPTREFHRDASDEALFPINSNCFLSAAMRRSTAVRSCPERRGDAVHSNGLVAWKLSVRCGGGKLESLTHDLFHVSKVCGDMLRSVLLRALDAYWGKTALDGEGHNVAHACQQTRYKMSTRVDSHPAAPSHPRPTGKQFPLLCRSGRAIRCMLQHRVPCWNGCFAGRTTRQ